MKLILGLAMGTFAARKQVANFPMVFMGIQVVDAGRVRPPATLKRTHFESQFTPLFSSLGVLVAGSRISGPRICRPSSLWPSAGPVAISGLGETMSRELANGKLFRAR